MTLPIVLALVLGSARADDTHARAPDVGLPRLSGVSGTAGERLAKGKRGPKPAGGDSGKGESGKGSKSGDGGTARPAPRGPAPAPSGPARGDGGSRGGEGSRGEGSRETGSPARTEPARDTDTGDKGGRSRGTPTPATPRDGETGAGERIDRSFPRATRPGARDPGASGDTFRPRPAPMRLNERARPLGVDAMGRATPGGATPADGTLARTESAPRAAPANYRGLALRDAREGTGGRTPGEGAERAASDRRGTDAERTDSGTAGERRGTDDAAARAERDRHAAGASHRSGAARAARHRDTRDHARAYSGRYRGYTRSWYRPSSWYTPWYPGYSPYWYHGVFVYGPYPWYHSAYYDPYCCGGYSSYRGPAGSSVHHEPPPPPARAVDRSESVSVGLRTGSYLGSYDNGASYGDPAVGVSVRYRPDEAWGVELAWMHAANDADASERAHDPVQASVQVFAAPWSRFSPYVSTGLTFTGREVQDVAGGVLVEETGTLWGPHLGLGAELALGQRASLNMGLDFVGYLNRPTDDLTTAGALQTNLGVNLWF